MSAPHITIKNPNTLTRSDRNLLIIALDKMIALDTHQKKEAKSDVFAKTFQKRIEQSLKVQRKLGDKR